MDFRILGPLDVRDGDRPLAAGRRQAAGPARAAAAARQRGRVERPPGGRALGRAPTGLEGAPGGGLAAAQGDRSRTSWSPGRPATSCDVEPGQLDLHRFEELAAEGGRRRDAGTRRAAEALAERARPVARPAARRPQLRALRSRPSSRDSRSCARRRSRTGSTPIWRSAATPRLIGELEALTSGAPAARAAARPAHARALPLRPPGRGARGLPRHAPRRSSTSWGSSPARR